MEKPTEIHLAAAKRVIRYLRGTTMLGIMNERKSSVKLQGWTGSDYA